MASPNRVEDDLRQIFKRCVICPTETPTCPDCPSGQICSLVPQTCDACSHMTCISNPAPPPPSSPKTNVGAIAGGVIGGVVFMTVVMFFLWRFWIKKRREQQEMEAEEWEEDEVSQQKRHTQFTNMRSDAASTRTRGSIANSILSRASNIIQIAYIPGVTNRNGSGHNSLLTNTPVPPIPAAYANSTPKSPLSNQGDALFFRPGDLRDSTYSDGSSIRSGRTNRDTQYTRQSITPSLARSSMMSDVYRDDATDVPMPALRVVRAAPKVVSVKSASVATSPSSEYDGSQPSTVAANGGVRVMVPEQNTYSAASPLSNGSNSAGGFAKATQINVKGKGRFPIARNPSDSSSNHTPVRSSPLVETATEEEEKRAQARKSLLDATSRAADPAPLIQPLDSPFFDASEQQSSGSSTPAPLRPNPYASMASSVRNERSFKGNKTPGGLSAVIEEAGKRGSSSGTSLVEPAKSGDESPFSDLHATK